MSQDEFLYFYFTCWIITMAKPVYLYVCLFVGMSLSLSLLASHNFSQIIVIFLHPLISPLVLAP